MAGSSSKSEVLDGPQRRRRWTTSEKLSIVRETYKPDDTVSLVARRHGVAPNQLFRWRQLAAQGALTATSAQEEVARMGQAKRRSVRVPRSSSIMGV